MALLFADSFEWASVTADLEERGHYNTNDTKITLDTTGGPDTDKALKLDNVNEADNFILTLWTAPTTSKMHGLFWIKTTASYVGDAIATGTKSLMTLANKDTTNNWTIGLNELGLLEFYRLEFSTTSLSLATTSTAAINDGNWHQVEFEAFWNGSSSTLKVWIDQTLDIDFTGDLDDSGDEHALDMIILGGSRTTGSGGGTGVWFKNIMIWDETGTGMTTSFGNKMIKMQLLQPDGAGDLSGFTPSAGSNYQNVDEVAHDGDTTYNSSGTATHTDLFTYGNLPASVSGVHAVTCTTIARTTTANKQRILQPVAKISTTEYNGSNQVYGTNSYLYRTHTWELSPATATVWTVSEVNSAQFGYELT